MARDAAGLGVYWARWALDACGDYCPLYRDIALAVSADRALLDRLFTLPAEAHQPNVLMGAVHDLLLREASLPLARVYASEEEAAAAPAAAVSAFLDLCHQRWDDLDPVCRDNRTQTNEVGRAAIIGLALTLLHQRHGRPLRLIDVGSSAGLNLLLDTYRLDYGPAGVTGPATGEVVVRCLLRGQPAPVAPTLPPLSGCVGLDRAPIDLADEARARWLVACTWPGTGRLARQAAAIAAARRDPPRLVQGDAIEGLAALLDAEDDGAGALPVVLTTWVLAYQPAEARARFREVLRQAGRRRPVAWMSAEQPGVVPGLPAGEVPQPAPAPGVDVVGLQTFAGEPDPHAEVLALAHPHGAWVDWLTETPRAGPGPGGR